MGELAINYREAHLDTDGAAVLALQAAEMVELEPDAENVPATVALYAQRCPASSIIWVAEYHGKIIGFARAEIHDNLPHVRLNEPARAGYLDELYVIPAHRKRKVASKLFNCVLSALWERGVVSVWGTPAKPHLRQFYARCGASDMGAMQVEREKYVAL